LALFVVFEGCEGCGKSTQAKALQRRMLAAGAPTVLTHEPGGTHFGEQVRRCLKQRNDTAISPMAELLLISASRAQLLEEVIRPALAGDKSVICDRYTYSTMAYQGYGRGLDLQMVHMVNDTVTLNLTPDLVVLLDMPVEVALSRKKAASHDRIERESFLFHHRVRQGYLQMAAAEPGRWLVMDATLPKKTIQADIWTKVSHMLGLTDWQ
jgi:dTMP kinase